MIRKFVVRKMFTMLSRFVKIKDNPLFLLCNKIEKKFKITVYRGF